jgi:sugar phosphate isomerase/epimerase
MNDGFGVSRRAISRRGLLGATAGLASAAVLQSLGGRVAEADGTCTGKVKDPQIGIQLFTCTVMNYANTALLLQQLAAIGYQKVEHAGWGSAMSPEGLRQACDDAGIECTSGHYGEGLFPYDKDAWKQTLEDCNVVGQTYVGVAGKPSGDNTKATWRKYCDAINRAVSVAQKAGFRQLFHHCHSGEWMPVDDDPDTSAVDIMMRYTDPDLFHVQMDIGWCYAAFGAVEGVCAQLRRYPGRFKTVHVKDIAEGSPVTPGTGEIGAKGFQRIFAAAKESRQNITEFHIENDSAIVTCLDTAQAGWDLLHGMRYRYRCRRR